MMPDDVEHSILEFLKQEALHGHLESTVREIAHGADLGYNQVGRALERLIMKHKVGYRERGTQRKSARYYYLKDVLELCQGKWRA